MRRRDAMAVVLPVVWLVSAIGCGGDNPVSPSLGVPFSITDLVVGTGAEALRDQVMTVAFTGWLFDEGATDNKGGVFDQSSAFRFRLGADNLIDGWNQGIEGMRVLGLRRIVVPPELGFGSFGSGAIPPNATLIFEIELLEIA